MIKWHYLPEMPDAEISVLVAVIGDDDSSEGYTDGANWYYQNGTPIPGYVYAWADMPACPAREPALEGWKS